MLMKNALYASFSFSSSIALSARYSWKNPTSPFIKSNNKITINSGQCLIKIDNNECKFTHPWDRSPKKPKNFFKWFY